MTTVVRKFFGPGHATDPLYTACRDTKWNPGYPELVEQLWVKFEPYCPDAHFLEEARSHFLERTWEMYLACVLLERGYELVRPRPKGPDICIIDGSSRIWVEAVAVGSGVGADHVLPRETRGRFRQTRPGVTSWAGPPPSDDSLILRYMSALGAKRSKCIGYRSDGIVNPSEPCVVAISVAQIEDADEMCGADIGIPIAVRSLFGIGRPYLNVPLYSDEAPATGHHVQTEVAKKSGARISTESFTSDAYAEISGIFCTDSGILRAPKNRGAEIVFVNNPFASAKISAGTFKFGTEYVADSEYLHPPQVHDKPEY
jgi:hypothetical protein